MGNFRCRLPDITKEECDFIETEKTCHCSSRDDTNIFCERCGGINREKEFFDHDIGR